MPALQKMINGNCRTSLTFFSLKNVVDCLSKHQQQGSKFLTFSLWCDKYGQKFTHNTTINENCSIHVCLGQKTHVNYSNAPRQLTAELWNRLQLTTEENFDSKLPKKTSAVNCRGNFKPVFLFYKIHKLSLLIFIDFECFNHYFGTFQIIAVLYLCIYILIRITFKSWSKNKEHLSPQKIFQWL